MKSRHFLSWLKAASSKKFTRNLPRKVFAAWLMVLLLWPNFLIALAEPTFAATSPWTQTDWSGGSGQSTWSDTTKFDSSSNAVTSVAGQATLSNSEKLSNTGIETDLTGWNQTGEGVASSFSDSTFAADGGAVAAWPLDETTSTQSYSRAVNPAVSSGRNIVVNGTFDADTNWTKASGTTIAGGVIHFDGTNADGFTTQTTTMVGGKYYVVNYTVSNYISGTIITGLGGNYTTGASANGLHTYTGVAGNPTVTLRGQNLVADIDNVTVTELNIPAYNATPTQLLADGTMEAAGTSSWTAGNSIMSKETGNPHGGSQVLRLTRSASPFRAGQAILTPGTVYRVTGYMRSDGSANPIVDDNTTRLLTGSLATYWQPIDFLFTATSSTFNLGGTGSGSSYVEFDDMVVAVDNAIRQTELLIDGNMEASVSNSGTATSATSNTLSDTGKTWTTNVYINQILTITGGTGSGQTRTISSNTSTAITVSAVWTVTPDSTSQYQIIPFWASVSGAPAISKQSTSPHGGTQVLRMMRSGSSTTLISQIGSTYIPGKTYRWTGYVRGDGTAIPRISNSAGALYFSGSPSTSWQPFDVTFVYPNSGATGLTLVASVDGQYIEWDDLSVTEVNPMSAIPTNGVVIGSTANGHLTNAYTFDGNNDNVNIYSGELNSVFNPDEGAAVVWAKASGSGVWTDATVRYLLSLTGPTGNKINLYRSSTNNTLALDYSANSVQELITSSAIGGSTSWFQIVATWSKTSDQVKFYINGTQVGSTSTGLGTWSGNIGSTTGAIGALGSAGGSSWSGMINDVRLYNRPLTATEISTMYNGGVATRDTSTFRSGVASMKVVTDNTSNLDVLQSVNVGDTNTYNLVVYAYTNGGAVTSADAELFYNGAAVSTTYTSVGSGWYKLSANVTGANAARNYGVQVKASKTVYLDDFSVNGYAASGTITSSIFDTGQGSSWGTLTYNAVTPTNTTVTVKARSSNSPSMTGATAFGTCTAISSGTDISSNNCMADNQRYVQYQLTLASTDTAVATPTFQDITIPFVYTDTLAPTITLNPITPDPTGDTTPTITGTATDTLNTVASVQLQVDSNSGTWLSCTADDGAFDEISETFSCTSGVLADGTHTFFVRSTDSNGYTTTGGSEATDTITVDNTIPVPVEADSPGDKSYTNNERPNFRWHATTDATGGLSKYMLEIDNPTNGGDQPTGDFTINDIPPTRTTDLETNKYTVRYENFADSDPTNNYISVVTKTSNEWTAQENDGKLREGVVKWKVHALDNSGNETVSGRTLFIDRSSPDVTLTQLNDVPNSTGSFITTDKTPTLFGKITDPLAGYAESSQTQTDGGPKVASGPKSLQVKIERKVGYGYTVVSVTNLNLTETRWSCTDAIIADNTQQTCNKYSPFSYTAEQPLEQGSYRILITGKDTADNEGNKTFTLTVAPLNQVATPAEQKVITDKVQQLPTAEQQPVLDQIEITKPAPAATATPQTFAPPKTEPKIAQVEKAAAGSNFFAQLATAVGNGFRQLMATLQNAGSASLAFLTQSLNSMIAFTQRSTNSALAGMSTFSFNLSHYLQQTATNGQLAFSNTMKRPQQVIGNLGSWLAFTRTSFAEIMLDQEPTQITAVKVEKATPTTMVITWQTNHLATSKVNYGDSLDYGQDVQSTERVHQHRVEITNLQPGQKYFYEVMSQGKNYVYDAHHEFTTPRE